MTRTLIITYEKSNEYMPVMHVEESGLLSTTPSKVLIHTGEKAEQLYKELTGQAKSEEKEHG